MANPIIFGSVTFLHDLFTAIWIGGLIILAFVVMPTVKQNLEKSPPTKKFLVSLQNRLRVFVIISMIGLLVTGIMMSTSNPSFDGLFAMSDTYNSILSIKHIMILGMIIVAALRSTIYRMKIGPADPRKEKIGMILLFVNAALGVFVLLFSGLLSAFA